MFLLPFLFTGHQYLDLYLLIPATNTEAGDVGVLARAKTGLTSLPRKGRLLSQIPHLSSLTVSLPLCGIAGEDAHVPGFGTHSMRKSECIILNTVFR